MSTTVLLSPEALRRAQTIFSDFDDENTGCIEIQQTESVLRAYGLNPTKQDVQDILSDVSRSNSLSFNTFCYLIYRLRRNSSVEKDLVGEFRVLDKNCTGKVTLEVFKRCLNEMAHPLTDKQLNNILDNLQVDNGFVDYREAVKLLIADK